MNDVAYRSYRASDLEAMYRMDVACFAAPFRFSRGDLRRYAEARNALAIVAENAEELAGFVIVETVERAGYVVTLDVGEPWRRRGIAKELMRRAEKWCAKNACDAMVLHVFVGNAEARRFYEGSGYVAVRAVKDFYGSGLDAMVCSKNLTAHSAAVE